MKKIVLLLVSVVVACAAAGQDGITFKVEKLSKPEAPLFARGTEFLYGALIDKDAGHDSLAHNIICHSDMPDELVTYGYHSFFDGMHRAYSDHRPFVLSPDMIWLLISQGFARHVNANPEAMRDYFVDFKGKVSLTVVSDDVPLDAPAEKWEAVFPEFAGLMSENTKDDIIDILSADFSTTGPVERIASQITVMDAMESYFEFIVVYAGCGIPEITLTGTPGDWQKILDKTKLLAGYDLEWWTSELVPLLEQFVMASKGKVKEAFWREMFKNHKIKTKRGKKVLYPPDIIDGWIVKFFPYDRYGMRNDLISVNEKLGEGHNLPDEIVKVDLKHVTMHDNGEAVTVPLELWAGFIGLEQNEETCALTPRIGWMIRIKDVDNDTAQQEKFERRNKRGEIRIRVREVPPALLKLTHIRNLNIEFTDKIVIPDGMKDIRIDWLSLRGEISAEELARIKSMFPRTYLVINGETITRYSPPSATRNLESRDAGDGVWVTRTGPANGMAPVLP